MEDVHVLGGIVERKVRKIVGIRNVAGLLNLFLSSLMSIVERRKQSIFYRFEKSEAFNTSRIANHLGSCHEYLADRKK